MICESDGANPMPQLVQIFKRSIKAVHGRICAAGARIDAMTDLRRKNPLIIVGPPTKIHGAGFKITD